MAKVFGPALSVDAKGTIAKGITYQGRPKGSAVIQRPVASRDSLDNPSLLKCNQRGIIGLLVARWQAMTTAERAVWDTEAGHMPGNLSGYHAFMKKVQIDLKGYLGLVGYWSMNEANGAQVKDLSGQGNHGTLKPSYPANVPRRVVGQGPNFGNALSFDSVDDYVDCGNDSSLDFGTSSFSVEILLKTTSAINQCGLFEKIVFWSVGFTMIMNNFKLAMAFGSSGGMVGWYNSIKSINDGIWHLCVAVVDRIDNKVYLFIDGILDSTHNLGVIGNVNTVNDLYIGSYSVTRWSDKLDEARLYNRALPALEILKHYYLLR